MNNEVAIRTMTDVLGRFTAYVGKKLPDDVEAKLAELREKEDSALSKTIYDTMFENQRLAMELDRPCCQDTGVIQYFVKCGSAFPLLGELQEILTNAVLQSTHSAPLRHNAVETFDERNTGKNIGTGVPNIFWDIVPGGNSVEIDVYMAGGGCSLPGRATVLMPSEGYEGAVKFVLDIMTSLGVNACPPVLVGIGFGTSIDVASLLSKKALMRPIGSKNPNERAANLEKMLEDGINKIGLGPQGMTGNCSVLGVNIENTARHPSVIAVGVNLGCWSHRRGHIIFDSNLNYTITSHKEAGI